MTADDPADDRAALFEDHPWLLEMRSGIESIANTDASVLIYGESRRMREFVARAIHAATTRYRGGFFPVNCSQPHLEVELFGFEGKLRTGELARKSGLLEMGEYTLYLDDIPSMSLVLQAKLLQVLQDRRVGRGQAEAPMPLMVRVIAATDRDLGDAVARGEFLEELYRLLKKIPAPPLTKEESDLAAAEEEAWVRLERARLEPIDLHNEACRAFARTGADEGLICPHCKRRSREDIEFVDHTGQGVKSFFVCRACGRSFGHEL
jgi:DNA-binding NtrC family response regulator